MQENLRQIIYLSQAIPTFSAALSDQMVSAASTKNQKRSITGCLVRSDDLFIQFIEGPSEAIEALYAEIKDDMRHNDVTLILDATSTKRVFPDWGMKQILTDASLRPSTIKDIFAADAQRAIDWMKSL